jgi:hypothetical protein
MQYYNASYMCRRVVRSIEITGVYDETETRDLVNSMASSGMEDIDVQVDAVYFSGRKIQLRQSFSVTLPIVLTLPITVKVAGMSEVFWK